MSRGQELSERQRFWAKVVKTEEGCWLWGAATTNSGYGSFKARGRSRMAHRYAYEECVGTIPGGLELDHKCKVRACVNPAHLEPVTRLENMRRASGFIADQLTRTHCPAGHPYSGENLFYSGRSRKCRICHNRCVANRKRRMRQTDGNPIERVEA